MKKNFKLLGGAAAIISAILIFGVFQVNSLANGIISRVAMGEDTSNIISSIFDSIYVLVFAIVATLTISIVLFVYYLIEEREISLVIIGAFGLAEVVLFITNIADISTKITNMYDYFTSSANATISSLLTNSFSTPSELLGLTPIMIVSIVEFIFIVLLYLQMKNKVHIGFIAKYAPKTEETIVNHHVDEEIQTKEEGGEA